MRIFKYKVLIITISFAALLFFLLYLASNLNQFNQDFIEDTSISGNNIIDITSILQNEVNGKKTISSKIYMASDNWKTTDNIINDIESLLKLNPDTFTNYELIVDALTINATNFNSNNLDSLYIRLNWAESLKYHSGNSIQHNIVFSAVSGYWLDLITNTLNNLTKENDHLKYEYRFRYLKTRLSNFDYFIGQGNSNFEKIILYFIDNRWTYLADRIWNGTSIFPKLIIMCIFIFTVYGYYCLFQKHIINKTKQTDTQYK